MTGPGRVTVTGRPGTAHLGELLGPPDADRVVALPTSEVFDDAGLVSTYWDMPATSLDTGFQAHLYTGARDTLVVRAPEGTAAAAERTRTAIRVNAQIWSDLTGVALAPPQRLLLTSAPRRPGPGTEPVDGVGQLLGTAAAAYRARGGGFLAFVLTLRTADALGVTDPVLRERARTATTLMDKNATMRLLQRHHVPCPPTHLVDGAEDRSEVEAVLAALRDGTSYVFKPAGGAAGIGVVGADGGCPGPGVASLVARLRRDGRLPDRFQVQEHRAGPVVGMSGRIGGSGGFTVFEVHQQAIDADGRFVGGRWTRDLAARHRETADGLYRRLAAIGELAAAGLLCLDVADGEVLEVNPRLTAGSAVAHLLALEERIAGHVGGGFRLRQVDLRSRVCVPAAAVADGRLRRSVETLRREHAVLALPQGLDPFGPSRMLFVNDDAAGTARQRFEFEVVTRSGTASS